MEQQQLCEEVPDGAADIEGTTFVKVKDSSKALGHIASSYFDNPTSEMKVVAVTGTNGKTTIVSLLHNLFRIMDRKAAWLAQWKTRLMTRVLNLLTQHLDALYKAVQEMADEGVNSA